MNNSIARLSIIVACLGGAAKLSHAQVPNLLNYQGRIVSNGTNFHGAGQFKFALVSANASQTFWANSAGSPPASAVTVGVSNGLYSVLLGDTTLANMAALPSTVFNNSDVRLRVWFNNGTTGFQQLAPDQRIAAVGYALMAATVPDGAIMSGKLASNAVTAASLANGSVSSAKIADNAITVGKLVDGAVTTTKLADGVVTASKLAQGLLANLGPGTTNISFGNCSNCARVDIYGSEINCLPTITLDGCDRRVSVSDPYGSEKIALKGGYYGTIVLKDTGDDTTVYLGYGGPTRGGEVIVNSSTGAKRIDLTGRTEGGQIQLLNAAGTPTVTIAADSSGSGRVITQVLEITGGADLSENFDINPIGAELQPGLIVCIDPKSPGRLIPSSKAYDRTVAGIVSGAGGVKPGMLMGQHGTKADGKHPVALTGRVYCWVDAAAGGAVEPGDLITTSNTPGHGMKADSQPRAAGAIIGKAMTALSSGKGLVLVLVSLQ